LRHFLRIHAATGGCGTWVLDRGFDRRELLVPMLAVKMAFVVRQRGDPYIWTADARSGPKIASLNYFDSG
jgi:hypothetical protein